jgi:hypothetical protein
LSYIMRVRCDRESFQNCYIHTNIKLLRLLTNK